MGRKKEPHSNIRESQTDEIKGDDLGKRPAFRSSPDAPGIFELKSGEILPKHSEHHRTHNSSITCCSHVACICRTHIYRRKTLYKRIKIPKKEICKRVYSRIQKPRERRQRLWELDSTPSQHNPSQSACSNNKEKKTI